eukprot:UN24121
MVISSMFFLVKACSIIVTRVKCMGMDGRADFSKILFVFLKGYLHFFRCKILRAASGHFLDVFFLIMCKNGHKYHSLICVKMLIITI